MSDHQQLEEGLDLQIDFKKLKRVVATKEDVLPTVVQNADTHEVLLIGYVNRRALKATLTRGIAVFWSTSRNELWVKGATSGDYLQLVDIRVNCEQNSLLYRVRPLGKGVCHTKDATGTSRSGCYYRRITPQETLAFIEKPSTKDCAGG